jgi:hypothetical protein
MPANNGENYNGLPGRPQPVPGFPENGGFINFEVFETLNTKPPRPAIKDSEMAWCDGFMPFGPSNLRTLPGVGDSIYTSPDGVTITAFWFYNFGDSTYAAVLLSSGGMVQVDLSTGTRKSILSNGTIQSPDPHSTSVTQWNSKYLIVVSDQDNGFWAWDGDSRYGVGGVSPETDITNAGQNYTGTPSFHFLTTATVYTPPTFSVTIENGFITEFFVDSPGSGFAVDDFVGVAFIGGGSDTTARASATINPNTGPIIDIETTDAGHDYGIGATVVLTGGGGTGASAVPHLSGNADQSFVIDSITVVKGGTGYNTAPTVTISAAHGTGWSGFARIGYGEITAISVDNAGTGYKSAPTVTIQGNGQGATAEAQINASGEVTSITVTNGGYGYTKALVTLSGGNDAAEASISLMPFGVQGTTVETYDNRIWVGDTRKGYFTAPSTFTNFKPSDGAGVFQSNDSFQRVAYHSFRQTNGFLYLISDSSINYIGGVQATQDSTTGSTSTVFNNLNVDPQIGTPWPSTVQLFSRNIVFANSFGIFVSYGGAVTKISTPLDGVYNTVVPAGSGSPSVFPSSAIASLFGIAVYMMLFPIVDPYTGQQINKLLMWDGRRWWTSNQDIALTYIASQEVNSILTAWGTDGSSLYPLFQTPSTGFQKVAQSKLWANPSYWFTKTAPEIAGIVNFYSVGGTVSVTLDNENSGAGVSVNASSSGSVIWYNNSNQIITWKNASNQTITWGAPGLALIGPQSAGQAGVLMGLTITTNAEDLAILSVAVLEQNYQSRA